MFRITRLIALGARVGLVTVGATQAAVSTSNRTSIAMQPGKHRVRVTPNANDHNEWTWQGVAVSGTAAVMVPKRSM